MTLSVCSCNNVKYCGRGLA